MQSRKTILGWLTGIICILIFVLCIPGIFNSDNTQQEFQKSTVQTVSKNNNLRCNNSSKELPVTINYSKEPQTETFVIDDDSIALAGQNNLNKSSDESSKVLNIITNNNSNKNIQTEDNNQNTEQQNIQNNQQNTTNTVGDDATFSGEDINWNDVKYDSDLYWLSKLINAEAEGEPYIGKIAVGNVVMNRVANTKYFKNSVKEVIFQSGQFEVVGGRLNLDPTQESIDAAYDVLYNGKIAYDMPSEVLYFNTDGKWWKGITVWKKIGHHYFGYQDY